MNLNSVLIEGCFYEDIPEDSGDNFSFYIKHEALVQGGSEVKTETYFFEVEVSGELAKKCRINGKKDKGIRVVGTLRQRFSNSADKEPVESVLTAKAVIEATHIEFERTIQKFSN